jgi:hypothetical protein
MRTTVRLDADVERLLLDEEHRSRRSFKVVLNDSVRRALSPRPGLKPKLLPPRPMGFKIGLDAQHLNALVDELETEKGVSPEWH